MSQELQRWRDEVRRLGFWFVDVPRTASTSLRVELGRHYGDAHGKRNTSDPALATGQLVTDHLTAAQVRDALGQDVWQRLFTFAFVRDPWSRTESMWRWRRREGSIPPDLSLSEYVRKLALGDHAVCGYPPHVAPCLDYVVGSQGELLVDHVADFADREAELEFISTRLPGSPVVGRVHTQRGEQGPAADWTAGMVELVGRVYRSDVEAFGFAPPALV